MLLFQLIQKCFQSAFWGLSRLTCATSCSAWRSALTVASTARNTVLLPAGCGGEEQKGRCLGLTDAGPTRSVTVAGSTVGRRRAIGYSARPPPAAAGKVNPRLRAIARPGNSPPHPSSRPAPSRARRTSQALILRQDDLHLGEHQSEPEARPGNPMALIYALHRLQRRVCDSIYALLGCGHKPLHCGWQTQRRRCLSVSGMSGNGDRCIHVLSGAPGMLSPPATARQGPPRQLW